MRANCTMGPRSGGSFSPRMGMRSRPARSSASHGSAARRGDQRRTSSPMRAVSLERRWTARLVPSPTKLPRRRPAESMRASLAVVRRSIGAGGRSRKASSKNRPTGAQAAAAMAIAAAVK